MYSFKKSIQPTKTALDRTNSNMLLSCWEYDSSLNSVASYGVLAVWPVVDPKVEKSTCIQIKSGNSISELSLGVLSLRVASNNPIFYMQWAQQIFIFNTEDRIQSDFLVVFIGWMLVFRVGYKSWNATLVASNKKQLGSQNGEDGNQLALKFQSLRMRELCGSLYFILSL